MIHWFPKFTFVSVSEVLIMKITKVRGLATCNRTVLLQTYDMWDLWSPWSICRTSVLSFSPWFCFMLQFWLKRMSQKLHNQNLEDPWLQAKMLPCQVKLWVGLCRHRRKHTDRVCLASMLICQRAQRCPFWIQMARDKSYPDPHRVLQMNLPPRGQQKHYLSRNYLQQWTCRLRAEVCIKLHFI